MPGFFVDRRKVYRVEVESAPDPETGESTSAWVDLRKFNEGDIQDRNDIATQIRTEARRQQPQLKGHLKKGGKGRKRRGQQATEEASMQYALGALRGFDLVRSIVDWNLVDDEDRRVPPTPDNIRALDPFSAGQIHDEIALLNPSIFPTQSDEDAQTPAAAGSAREGYLEYEEDSETEDGESTNGQYVTSGGEVYSDDRLPQNEDDELYGADEDAPPEAGGIGARDGAPVDGLDADEDVDPTRRTSVSRR